MSVWLVWYGHDAFRLGGPPVVYVDPWNLPEDVPLADVILITHEHYDHCSPEDVEKILGPDTVIVAPAQALKKLNAIAVTKREVKAGDSLRIGNLTVDVVPAYNVNKRFHPQKAGHVGYVMRLYGTSVYHAGDTDLIPEMQTIRCDVALLPVSGRYVMTAEEAAKAAELLQPRLVIPMHYGAIVGSRKDAERLMRLTEIPVLIPEPEEPVEIG